MYMHSKNSFNKEPWKSYSNILQIKSDYEPAVLGCAMDHMTWEGCDCVEHRNEVHMDMVTQVQLNKSLYAVHYQ